MGQAQGLPRYELLSGIAVSETWPGSTHICPL